MKWYIGSIISCLCLISACGGGGGSDSNDTPVISSSDPITIYGDTSAKAGQAVALVAMIEGGNADSYDYTWQQTSGSNLTIADNKSPVLSFDTTTAGSYSFSVSVVTPSATYTQFANLEVSASSTSFTIRSDHTAREGSEVSFREYGASGTTSWTQTAGPDVTLDRSTSGMAFFTAPSVTQDTLLSFNVTEGENSDAVHLLVKEAGDIATSAYFDERVAKVTPYNSTSTYAAGLEKCVYNNSLSSPCSVAELPLIGQVTATPSIDDVMNRVLVSHAWMGDNFKDFLQAQLDAGNSDFLTLLKSVTAVVISYDVRPSFYWVVTGAIYLDPNNLWLTPEQRDAINEAPDFRSAFGQDLQYLMPWRYVKDNAYASVYLAPGNRQSRTLSDLEPDLASLLYHELAHANDFFPSNTYDQIDQASLLAEFNQRSPNNELISSQLDIAHPLNSTEMKALAQVKFFGETATAMQNAYQATDIQSFYSLDAAAIEYGYSTVREDLATLFDAAMMKARYNIDRDVAITNRPEVANGDTIIAVWGQRNRVGDDSVKPRVSFVLERLLPDMDTSVILDALPAPTPFSQASWNDNLDLSATDASPRAKPNAPKGDTRPLALDLTYPHK